MTERVRIVSGSLPSPASATAAKAGNHDGLLGAVADAPVGDAGAAVPGVEQAAQFLVSSALGPKMVSISSNRMVRRVGVRDGAEQRGGGGVDRVHRPRDKQGEDFQRAGFTGARLGGEEREPGGGVERVEHVRVRGPQRDGGVGVLGRQGAEPADERATSARAAAPSRLAGSRGGPERGDRAGLALAGGDPGGDHAAGEPAVNGGVPTPT